MSSADSVRSIARAKRNFVWRTQQATACAVEGLLLMEFSQIQSKRIRPSARLSSQPRCRDGPDEVASRWYDVGAQESAGDWLATFWSLDKE